MLTNTFLYFEKAIFIMTCGSPEQIDFTAFFSPIFIFSHNFFWFKQASRAQILDKATEYIQYMRRKNHTHQQDIDDLKKQNALLEQQGEWWEEKGLIF